MLLITLPAFSVSQDFFRPGFYSPGNVDPRSIAMGRTSIVSATGSNAIFSNPAIIATLDKWQCQAGGRMIMGTTEDEWANNFYKNYNDKLTPHLSLNHISAAIPFQFFESNLKLGAGIGYRTYFDWGRNSKTDKTYENGHKYSFDNYMNGGLRVITPTLAINLQDKYFIGITFNKSIFGSIKYDTDFNDNEEFEITHSASFLQLGGLTVVNQQLTLGFSYTPEFKWKWDKHFNNLVPPES